MISVVARFGRANDSLSDETPANARYRSISHSITAERRRLPIRNHCAKRCIARDVTESTVKSHWPLLQGVCRDDASISEGIASRAVVRQ